MISPSKVKLAELCMARAVAAYDPEQIREPESPAMFEGTRLHRVVQSYLRDGAVPQPTDVAAVRAIAATGLGPGSVDAADIERVVLLPGAFGYIDYAPAPNVVGDLKFSKSVKYQKAVNPYEDAQRLMYAADTCYRMGARRVTLHWVVTEFAGWNAVRIETTMSRSEVTKAYAKRVLPIADRLTNHLERGTDWRSDAVEKNPTACNLYPPNGCPCRLRGCKPPNSFARPK